MRFTTAFALGSLAPIVFWQGFVWWHDAPRPVPVAVLDAAPNDDPSTGTPDVQASVARLQGEIDRLEELLAQFAQERESAFVRVRQSLGHDFAAWLNKDALAISMLLADPSADGATLIHGRDYVRHALAIERLEQRLAQIRAACAEGEAWLRFERPYRQAVTEQADPGALAHRLYAVSTSAPPPWEEPGQEEIADHLAVSLGREREEIAKREAALEAERARLAMARKAQAEAARQRELEIAAAAVQRRAEAEETRRRENEVRLWEIAEAARQVRLQREREQAARQEETGRAAATVSYAEGLRQFAAGRYSTAIRWFDDAISLHGDDARFYHYRGLAYYRLGNGRSAVQDVKTGGALERATSQRSSVSTALERVQGSDRLLLERYR